MPRRIQPAAAQNLLLHKLTKTIGNFLSVVPESEEPKQKDPFTRARQVANVAAGKAAMVSGGLALPAGPLGFATILPDLIAIWRLQSQMVADIAAVFGKSGFLTREQMAYCLFKHAAAQIVRDLVSRVGGRYIIKQVPMRTMQTIVQKIAGKTTQRVISKALSRWLPLVGALGVGAYAYYDTAQVGKTAIELFSEDLEFED